MKLVTRGWLHGYILQEIESQKQQRQHSQFDIKDEVQNVFRYAILSHRWGREEIDTVDLLQGVSVKGKQNSRKKLGGFFAKARAAGYRFVWFDSGCIDQRNGPEVDESIRSMFSWYRNADSCFVYLRNTTVLNEVHDDEWFKRGWTLQELLAPKRLVFFNKNWCRVSSNIRRVADVDRQSDWWGPSCQWSDLVLREEVIKGSAIVEGDSHNLLESFQPCAELSREVFGYVSNRRTTRPEDMAYCVISLLNVHMPIAYGEGAERAFYRLQLACLQDSKSRSILHWEIGLGLRQNWPSYWNTMLAQSPSQFQQPAISQKPIYFDIFDPSYQVEESFTVNNGGMRIMMCLFNLGTPSIGKTLTFRGECCSLQLLAAQGEEEPRDTSLTVWPASSPAAEDSLRDSVIGIYGWSWSKSYGVVLKKGCSAAYTRSEWWEVEQLPPMDAFLKSDVRPQWVYIE